MRRAPPFARRWLVRLVLLVSACREPDLATQVLVHVEGEEALVSAASALRLRVVREDAADWQRTEPLGPTGASVTLPTTLPLEPRNGDATRRFHVVAELLDSDGTVRVTERALGGYVAGERRHVTLRLTARCEEVECGAQRTCVEGRCVDACVDPTATRTATRTPPVPCQGLDAGLDAGTDAGSDAGEDAALEDSGVDAPPDAGSCAPIAGFDLAPNHACVLLADGSIRCEGSNGRGALGVGHRRAVVGFAEPVAGGPWRDVVVGDRASCGIDVGDALFCWGDDPGRLGLADDTRDTTVPQRVTGTGSTTLFRRVAIGAGHGCAPRFSDPPNVYCFGRNDYGQSGGTPGDTLVAPAASVMLGSAFAITTGDRHTCVARTTSPSVVCWGHNDYGQLAVSSSTVDMTGSPRSASIRAYSLAAGASFTCVLRDPDSRPVCWGDNRGSQCGAAPTREVGRTVVPLDDAVVPRGLDAGDSHACIVAEDGSVWCWGSNAAGQLGLGMDAGPTTPTPMRSLGEGYVDVRASADRTCARRGDGSLWCWGRGNGTPTPVCLE
ncbi:MAG: hypothetical protein H6722_04345 [Sandaracinus sp.]|nr:hypothetical protein [Sandaracinus sp.]MCB9618882.1 hypothetical protein [Sandaracinus sp.]